MRKEKESGKKFKRKGFQSFDGGKVHCRKKRKAEINLKEKDFRVLVVKRSIAEGKENQKEI